jgi:hypothetical protein
VGKKDRVGLNLNFPLQLHLPQVVFVVKDTVIFLATD